jgi:hypothetical protein
MHRAGVLGDVGIAGAMLTLVRGTVLMTLVIEGLFLIGEGRVRREGRRDRQRLRLRRVGVRGVQCWLAPLERRGGTARQNRCEQNGVDAPHLELRSAMPVTASSPFARMRLPGRCGVCRGALYLEVRARARPRMGPRPRAASVIARVTP